MSSSQVLHESLGAAPVPRVALCPQRGGGAHVEVSPLLSAGGVVVEPRAQLVVPHHGIDGGLKIVADVPEIDRYILLLMV